MARKKDPLDLALEIGEREPTAAELGEVFEEDQIEALERMRAGGPLRAAVAESTPEPEPEPGPPEPPPVPEPAPAEPEPEEEPPPPPSHPGPEEEPEWIAGLSEDAAAYVRQLAQENRGQRVALARRRQELDAAQADRRMAIQLALRERESRQVGAAPEEVSTGGGKGAPPGPGGLPVQVDAETGRAFIPDDEARAYLNRLTEPERRAQAEAAQREQARMGEVQTLLADTGVSAETATRLDGAFREMVGLFQSEVAPRQPRTPQQERAMMREAGIEQRLQAKYPGITLEALYDVWEGAANPWAYGYRMVERVAEYSRRWGGNGKPGTTASGPAPTRPSATPRRVPEHPAPLSRKGTGESRAPEGILDQVVGLTLDQALDMSEEEVKQIYKRWGEEFAER